MREKLRYHSISLSCRPSHLPSSGSLGFLFLTVLNEHLYVPGGALAQHTTPWELHATSKSLCGHKQNLTQPLSTWSKYWIQWFSTLHFQSELLNYISHWIIPAIRRPRFSHTKSRRRTSAFNDHVFVAVRQNNGLTTVVSSTRPLIDNRLSRWCHRCLELANACRFLKCDHPVRFNCHSN